jgi:hypothetical protein
MSFCEGDFVSIFLCLSKLGFWGAFFLVSIASLPIFDSPKFPCKTLSVFLAQNNLNFIFYIISLRLIFIWIIVLPALSKTIPLEFVVVFFVCNIFRLIFGLIFLAYRHIWTRKSISEALPSVCQLNNVLTFEGKAVQINEFASIIENSEISIF